jgi:hypothetical protein
MINLDITKLAMGENGFHIPLNFIVQQLRDGDKVAGVFQTSGGRPMLFGSDKTHILILADAIVRPRMVIASNHMQGAGIGHLYMQGFAEDEIDRWINRGDVLLGLADEEYKRKKITGDIEF